MKKSLAPSAAPVTARDSKGTKFVSVVEAAYNKARLSDEEAQSVNDTPGLSALITDFIAKNRNPAQYADEEVESRYGYYSGYKPKSLVEQLGILQKLVPEFGVFDDAIFMHAEKELPQGAEGLFVVPTWQSFAKLHGVSTYAEVVTIVLAKLAETYGGKFYNYRTQELASGNIRETARKAEGMAEIAESQKGHDLLIVSAQFGIAHRGRSVRRARVVIGNKGFGLGAFEVGIMLLLHPERLQHYDDLWIDCAGDELKPGGERVFSDAPIFNFHGGKLWFVAFRVDDAHGHFGSASALLPQ